MLQSRKFLRGNKLLGSFKLDVATVWSQPGTECELISEVISGSCCLVQSGLLL